MKLHAQAALTLKQRQEVKRLHEAEGMSIRKLAESYQVNPTTIQRWVHRDSPLDRSAAPIHPHTVITPEYREAVISYRKDHPRQGPVRIALALKGEFPLADRGTVLPILQQEGLSRPVSKPRLEPKHIPVGRHRIQMDIQELPAIQGGKGFEYKISVIHLRTRLKYSEIHSNHKSATLSQVLKRALDLIPPFSSSGPITPRSLR